MLRCCLHLQRKRPNKALVTPQYNASNPSRYFLRKHDAFIPTAGKGSVYVAI
jgi:hypothetical protein